jgi:catechol-2,3-dioxygenase
MIGKLRSTVIDWRDPGLLATFYAGVLGGALPEEDDTWVVLTDPKRRRLAFQLSPEHEPPQFPDPRGSQQFHLDIAVDDRDAAGHTFCLVWGINDQQI